MQPKINLWAYWWKIAQSPAYGHWTLVQRKPRRPNPGRRFTDRSYMVQNNKPPGPNSQKMDIRENRFSLLDGLDASSSGSKRPNSSSRATPDNNTSQPTWAKGKNRVGPKEQNRNLPSSTPLKVPNPPQLVNLENPTLIGQNIPPPPNPFIISQPEEDGGALVRVVCQH